MADLPYIDQKLEVTIVGQDSTGNTTNPVNSTSWGLQVDPSGVHSPVNLNDGAGNSITSSSNANSDQLLHVQTPDTFPAFVALNALNASISISMEGLSSVGFQMNAGTFIGTIQAQASIDGGVSWVNVPFYNPTTSSVLTSVTFLSANPLTILTILPLGGCSNVRVIVSAYTSGTADSYLRASKVTGVSGSITSAAFGSIVNSTITLSSISPSLILAANPNRKYAYISNCSFQNINIQFGSSTGLSTTVGLAIPTLSIYELKGTNLYTGDIYGIATSKTSVIAIAEGTP